MVQHLGIRGWEFEVGRWKFKARLTVTTRGNFEVVFRGLSSLGWAFPYAQNPL
jgi:hypothetical protein